MQRMETLDEGKGLKGTFHFWDQKISGTVENKTGYDLESCVIAVPGYCALIGDIKNGETITLDGIEADSVPGVRKLECGRRSAGDREKLSGRCHL